MKAAELCNIAGTLTHLTREIQTKLNFKFIALAVRQRRNLESKVNGIKLLPAVSHA